MNRIRWNGGLLAVAAVVLMLCDSGYALKCYNCSNLSDKPCLSNTTCPASEDACLLVVSGSQKLTSCFPYNSCNTEGITKKFGVNSFSYYCCQKALCNNSVMAVVNKTVFSLVTMLALIWICF
ncbi:CD59 glycoprotein [Ambystoma mexicanum]|uniref:CD59 glycoprotein n=1 Tax=Ambystoma mexicanum TaxID=8296 RepID=UPI0037E7369B